MYNIERIELNHLYSINNEMIMAKHAILKLIVHYLQIVEFAPS